MFKDLKLKKVLKELFVTAFTLFVILNMISYFQKPELSSDTLPNIDVTLLDGSRFSSSSAEGKPLIIHIWGSWCRVCRLEAENIERVSERYNVLSIAVNSGSDETVKAYMKEKGLSFKVLNDTKGEWAKKFKVEVFPTTFVYDGKGKLQFTDVGYTTTAGLLARAKLAE